MTQFFSVMGTLFAVCYSAPIIMAVVFPLLVAYFFVQRSFRRVSRQLKRMISISISPINSSLTETYQGASTIRAFNLERKFIEDNNQRIDSYLKFSYPGIAASTWLCNRLELLSSMVSCHSWESFCQTRVLSDNQKSSDKN